jgi:hypothetical protein
MTTPSESDPVADEPVAAATNLADSLNNLAGQLAAAKTSSAEQFSAVEKFGRKNRHFIWGLILSIVLDVTLSILAFFLVNSLHNTQNQVVQQQSAARTTQYSQCVTNNDARAQDKTLWDVFFADLVPPGSKPTPKIAAELARLNKIVNDKDAPRDCKTLYG